MLPCLVFALNSKISKKSIVIACEIDYNNIIYSIVCIRRCFQNE